MRTGLWAAAVVAAGLVLAGASLGGHAAGEPPAARAAGAAGAEEAGAEEILRAAAAPPGAEEAAPGPEAQAAAAASGEALRRGPVTNLPLPRYVSLKTSEGNARRGPGLAHAIDWVFTRRNMPLRVTAEFENWRRVEDRDGAGGWVHYTLLSGVRTVLVDALRAELRSDPAPGAPLVAVAEQGVVARLLACRRDWCRIEAGGRRGWVEKTALWGVAAGEVFD